MSRRRSASAARSRMPTTDDISQETRELFDNAGDDVDPLELTNPESQISELERLISPSAEWDDQVNGMQKLVGYIRGGALSNDYFRRNMLNIASGLATAATNLRSALVKQSCLTIAALVRELGPAFDQLGDFVNPLSGQLGHGTQIIADSCKFAILTITLNCPSRKIMLSLIDLAGKRGAAQKAVAAEALGTVFGGWDLANMNSIWPKVEAVILKLIADASQEVRAFARTAVKYLQANDETKYEKILSHLDARTRKTIEGDVTGSPAAKQPATSQSRRTPSVQPVQKNKPVPGSPPSARRGSQYGLRKPLKEPESPVKDQEMTVQPKARREVVRKPREEPITLTMRKPEPAPEEKPKPETRLPTKRSASASRSNIPVARKMNASSEHISTRVDNNPPTSKGRRPVTVAQEDERPARRSSLTSKQNIVAPKKFVPAEAKPNANPKHVLDSGKERSFLADIRKLINDGKTADMESNMTNIALGVAKCCSHSSPEISTAAVGILHDIIPPFADHFRPSLPKLIPLLIQLIEISHQRAAAIAQTILNEMPEHFDVNDLLRIAGNQLPTIPILNFIGKLVGLSEASLTDDELCMPLLRIATFFQNHKSEQECHTAAHVIVRIDEVNHNVVMTFCDTLAGTDKKQFETFIHRYLPDATFEPVEIEVPKYNSKSVASFRHSISDLVKSASGREWENIRSQVYTELSNALFDTGNVKPTLVLITNILSTKGTKEYHKLLPGILHQMKREYREIVDNIIVSLLKETDVESFVAAIRTQISSVHVATSQAAIDLITRMISSVIKRNITGVMPRLFPDLKAAFQSEAAEIRKAVVLCFVEAKVFGGTEVDQFITQLTKSQQKLITVYYERRIGKQ